MKFFGFFLFFVGSLLYFLPKSSLYYYGEKELYKHKVILSEELIKERGFSLELEDSKLFYDSLESAKISSIEIRPFLVHNSIIAKDIVLTDIAVSFLPLKIEDVKVTYSIFNPLNIVAKVEGEFGHADITIGIVDKKINLHLIPSELMLKKYTKSLRMFKKDEQGEYHYAKDL